MESQIGVYGIFAASFILAVTGVFMHSKKESTSYDTLQASITSVSADVKSVKESEDNLIKIGEFLEARVTEVQMKMVTNQELCSKQIQSEVDKINTALKKVESKSELLEARQHSMDKKLAGQTRHISLSVPTPIDVQYSKKPSGVSAQAIKGQGAGALLNRAGIKPEDGK